MKGKWAKFSLLVSVVLLACAETTTHPGGCGEGAVPPAPPPEVLPGDCTLQITLNKADAGYTSDLYLDGPSPDLLIASAKNNVGKIATRYYDGESTLRFFIKVKPSGFFANPYKVYSDGAWAKVTQESETAQLIAFEDVPYRWSDKDYNDVVIAVEKVNCEAGGEGGDPGEEPPPTDPPPPPEPPPVVDPYFNLAVCYEGVVGDQAALARFGYLGRALNPGNVERNTVTNNGALPEGIPVGLNTERVWSTNTYELNANNYVWTVSIDGKQKTGTIDKLGGANSVVTSSNKCPVVVVTPPPDPEPEPTPIPGITIPAGGAAKVHVNFLQATFKLGDLYLAGDPPELLVAKGSNKKGASARNFFAEGEELVFFMRVDGTDYYSNDPEVALVDPITDLNYRIYFDVNWDGDYNDVIVHVVLTPPDR